MKRAEAGGDNLPIRAPDCITCRYFKVTWEPAYPRSCRLFGIKSRALPSIEVFRATGRHCPSFQRREKKE
ncbi:MAG: hypothetical protein LBD24_05595 [Spirochaetaceae bacterium]|nr:hypothetical protein [Spirochaetaceae bacterium]